MKERKQHTTMRAAHFLKALGKVEIDEVRYHSRNKN
jgi:tritrans,polycis-undecaprenyl-diphosphate synthase [geranylgeranyl-diphosphate specific]